MQGRASLRPAAGRPSRQAGFTLLELLVVIVLIAMLTIALLDIFDRNVTLARTQTQVSDLQQSLRTSQNLMSRMVRMAGRGGLAAMINDGGVRKLPALDVIDNIGEDGGALDIVPGLANGPQAVAGTDVLTVRGVFTNSLFQINTLGNALTLYDSANLPTESAGQAASGTVVVANPSPGGSTQPLDELNNAIALGQPEALILVSSVDESIYAVVELAPGSSVPGASQVTLAFRVSGGSHPGYRDLYASGTGGTPVLPSGLTTVGWIGFVEEYRFYVRDADPNPMLSMARMFPGTEVPYGGPPSASLDVAENVQELQLALGFDSNLGAPLVDRNGDGEVDNEDMVLTESADGENDDWLFNGDDDPNESPWAPPWDDDPTTLAIPPRPQLHYLRISTLARTRAPQLKYQAPIIPGIENAIVAPLNGDLARMYRRQLLTTTIDLRNVS